MSEKKWMIGQIHDEKEGKEGVGIEMGKEMWCSLHGELKWKNEE